MARTGLCIGAALLLAAGPALGQAVTTPLPGPPPAATLGTTSLGPVSPSLYAAATVKQFLAICGGDQGGCADEVGEALIDKMTFDGSANICLPGPDYAPAAVKWLGDHPETGSMPTEAGIYLALQKVYSCT